MNAPLSKATFSWTSRKAIIQKFCSHIESYCLIGRRAISVRLYDANVDYYYYYYKNTDYGDASIKLQGTLHIDLKKTSLCG